MMRSEFSELMKKFKRCQNIHVIIRYLELYNKLQPEQPQKKYNKKREKKRGNEEKRGRTA